MKKDLIHEIRFAVFVLLYCYVLAASPHLQAGPKTEHDVVYGMYSGLALLMDVYHPEKPNGFAIIHATGTGWHDQLGYDAVPPKSQRTGDHNGRTTGGCWVHPLCTKSPRSAALPLSGSARGYSASNTLYSPQYAALRRSPRPNRGRGRFFGGHLIAMAGVLDGKGDTDDPDVVQRESAKLQCVIVRAAPVDLIRMNMNHEFGINTITSLIGMPLSRRDPKTSRQYQAYWKASPINFVAADDPPFLLIHGDADRSVPILESESMQQALQSVGVAAKLIRIPGGAHGPTFPGARSLPDLPGEMTRWLQQHLLAKN